MLLPVLVVTAEAIRTNAAERAAVEALGAGMARTRTFSELEGALQAQVEVLWRAQSGFDVNARREYAAAGEAVQYWETRWQSELRPSETALRNRLDAVQRALDGVADSIFTRIEQGDRAAAWALSQRDLRGAVLPALTATSRDIYGQLRQTSVRAAFARLEEILAAERRTLLAVFAGALVLGALAALRIARGIARPVAELQAAMAAVGAGHLDATIRAGGRDELGRLASAFAQMRDDLQAAQTRLVQAEKLAGIGEMSAAVAHGLRNPLAGLRASAQLALRLAPGSPDFQETLHGIIEETDRLDRRITHLLDFSRPAPHAPVAIAPRQLVDAVIPAFTEQFAAQGITVALAVPTTLPPVHVDPAQYEQVLVELFSNAMAAMPTGGTLSVQGSADDEVVVLLVRDTGVGIPAQTLPQVTDAFFTTRAEGTGLGLAAVRRFVELNEGTVRIESEVHRGTTVRLTLPVARR